MRDGTQINAGSTYYTPWIAGTEITKGAYRLMERNLVAEMTEYPNHRDNLKAYGIVAELTVTRPRGRKTWLARETNDGRIVLILSAD